MTNIRSLVNDITSSDNVSAAEKISDIMAEKLQTLLDLAKIEVAQGMFNTCEECEEPVLTQEQYDMLSDDEKADYEAIDEALVGNQKKIDANKNGKLDAQDFKMLRAKKGMKEENEVEEAYTDPYAAKKAAEMKKAHAATMADAKKEYDAAKKTKFAKNFMKMKKEEVEQIDEISQFKKNEIAHELRHEDEAMAREAAKKRKYAPTKQEPHAVHIGGKKWKSFGSQAHASAVAKKLEAKGKKATVHKEEVQIDEVITKKTPTGEVISDFVHSKNPMFKGKSKKERIRMALGAKYAMMRKEEVELDEANKENKAMKNAFVKKQGDKNPQQEKDSMGMPVKSGHVAVKHGGVKGGRLAMKQKKDPLASGIKRSEFTDASKKMISKSQNAAVKQQPKPKLP